MAAEIKWTKEQLDAIETRGGNILVAAAAGSGKTAVLVERIIRMICDKDNPVSVDELLVLTYTDAAAGEMRRKIAEAINKALENDPDNAFLQAQSVKVSSACISTIHAYCNRILCNNSYLTDFPAEFSLINSIENDVLIESAIDSVLKSYYEKRYNSEKNSAFYRLVNGWGGIKDDRDLRDTVTSLYHFMRSLANPREWFKNIYRKGYANISDGTDIATSIWSDLARKEIQSSVNNMSDMLEALREVINDTYPRESKVYIEFNDTISEFCSGVKNLDINNDDEYKIILNRVENFDFPRLARKGISDNELNRIDDIKDIVKKIIADIKTVKQIYNEDKISKLKQCAPIVKTLFNIVKLTERVHTRYKRERSVIDFGDMEHGLLKLISKNGKRTPICLKLRDKYKEILIDEFQDINNLQFKIFEMLSKDGGNLFMVGDVKQAIYKFRNADPSIFLRLYGEYGEGKNGTLIRLAKNFRSRGEVIDSVNYIFSSVMNKEMCGIDYTKSEYLIQGAEYPEASGCTSEFAICSDIEKTEEDAVAERIRSLVCDEKFYVTDKETKELRPVRYGDIAVLSPTRNLGIVESLAKLSIGTISNLGETYLDSTEIEIVLSFLKIIDNPFQDIPLIAVMRSQMFNFTAEELAKIRSFNKNGAFYEAVTLAAESDKKTAGFYKKLNELRKCSKYMGVDELVWKICNELDYFSIVGAMSNGDVRQMNLKLLLKRCSDYEQGVLTGLFNFMKYIKMLRQSKEDLIPAKKQDNTENLVTVMTVHASKGLEFPVVVLTGLSKGFNMRDTNDDIIWDFESGIGLNYVDVRQRVKYELPSRKLIKNAKTIDLKAEKMRLLYVAMTRAKEKLIMFSTINTKGTRNTSWKKTVYDENGRVLPMITTCAMSMGEWIWSVLLKCPSAEVLRGIAKRDDLYKADEPELFKITTMTDDLADAENEAVAEDEHNEESDVLLDENRISYEYPYSGLSHIPMKLSVSELKRRKMPEEDYSTGLLNTPIGLVEKAEEISASERGTVTHYVMQHLDIHQTDNLDMISKQIDGMVENSVITRAQAECVNVESLLKFFESPLGIRLKNAEEFKREYDFYMIVPTSEVVDNIDDAALKKSDGVMLQGIADCFFYEGDGIVLIDYKTDRVSESGAMKRAENYRMQIDYYARGLSDILEVPVKEKYLYFLNCNTEIKM